MPHTWNEVRIRAHPDLSDALAAFLIDQGSPGVQVEPRDGNEDIIAYFEGAVPMPAIESFCRGIPDSFPGLAVPQVRTTAVREEEWAESWKAHFPTLEIGDRLFIHPPWIREVPHGRLGIVIDPGMAFGTGHHASTSACLRLLEPVMLRQAAPRVLDLGTGSGILAIAAARLGAREVWGVDVDADACRIAIENCTANEVDKQVHIVPALTAAPGRFDVILANLFAQQLIDLCPALAARACPGGTVIGAGILTSEADAVVAAWGAAGLCVMEQQNDGEWVALRAVRA